MWVDLGRCVKMWVGVDVGGWMWVHVRIFLNVHPRSTTNPPTQLTGIGENLYSLFITSDFGQLSNVNCVNAVAPWYDEIALYNYDQVCVFDHGDHEFGCT